MISFLLVVVTLLGSHSHEPPDRIGLGTYPINPVPLRALCESADLIAVVQPGRPVAREQQNQSALSPSHEVNLKIMEILKGNTKAESICVSYSGNLICPSPAHFTEGWTHLVFLRKRKNGEYQPCALSYGSKQIEGEELKAYVKAVRKWNALARIKNSVVREVSIFNWVVSLAENPYTRWEGAVDLNRTRYLSTGYRKKEWPLDKTSLSAAQQERLIRAVHMAEEFDYPNQELFQVLEQVQDPRLAARVVQWIGAWGEDIPYYAGYWLHQAVQRRGGKGAVDFFAHNWAQEAVDGSNLNWDFQGSSKDKAEAVKTLLGLLRSE